MTTLARFILIPLLFVLIPLHAASAEGDQPALSDGEIRQLLAPIALYPDALLSQILIASTYPLEVVEAARWVRDNRGLEGQAAVAAVEDRDWDLSIKSLVAFPEVIERMSVELDWTRRLGDAFLLQEDQVIAAIQDLRERAEAAGTFDTLEHARAKREGDVIIIEPANSQIVYVPYYTPHVVYGGWWWPGYPPHYWHAPGVVTSAGFYWGGGILISSGFYFSTFDWGHRHIVISSPYRRHFRYVDSPRWRHDPYHRRGVVYRQPALNRQFGRTASRPAVPVRQESRPSALQRHHGSWESRDDRPTSSSDRRAGSRTHIPSRGSALNRSTRTEQRSTDSTRSESSQDRPASFNTRSTTQRGPAMSRSGSRSGADSPQHRSSRETTTRSTRGSHSRSTGSDTRRSFSSDGGSRSSGGGGGGDRGASRGSALSR